MTSDNDTSRGGFSAHLNDAISINQRRRPMYEEMTQGRSRSLSKRLIWSERLCLPAAYYLDRKARPFNDRGIGVIRDDFVSMDHIRPPETPPKWTEQASADEFKQCKTILADYSREICAANKQGDFASICAQTEKLLHSFEKRQQRTNAHFAMSIHLLESIGFGACNGLRWARESDGATLGLSKKLIYSQARTIAWFLSFDKWAQPLYQEGCGILINDIPSIPFLERYHS